MRTLSAQALAALSGGTVALAQLVQMDLSQTVYLSTAGFDLVWNGKTWRGAPGLGTIDAIEDGVGEVKGARFQLSAVASDQIALALAEPYKGKQVTVRTAIFDASTQQVIDAPVEWAGLLDTMSIQEQGGQAVIAVTAEHIGLDALRPAVGRYSDADQQRLFPGDRGLEYLIDQAEQPIVWPARSYYFK